MHGANWATLGPLGLSGPTQLWFSFITEHRWLDWVAETYQRLQHENEYESKLSKVRTVLGKENKVKKKTESRRAQSRQNRRNNINPIVSLIHVFFFYKHTLFFSSAWGCLPQSRFWASSVLKRVLNKSKNIRKWNNINVLLNTTKLGNVYD